ncbi:hypothetical protein [Natrialba sp. PRR66]|uniref:hypothetical protein n=1 Tax=Natrialba sp. PRR66 TaxID=3098146 RepID=UPI002B1E321F|nr:hypothetical protein [Natrialba sp. PRR66]
MSIDDFDDDNVSSQEEFASGLAQSTDILFEEPPEDVEVWNSGDFQDFSPGDERTSVYPESAELEDGLYIQDAHVSIFAIQPSTVLHSGNESTHYIAPDGKVLVLSDYRVRIPDNDDNGSIREEWSVAETEIDRVELFADGQTIDSGDGHQSTLEYSELSGDPTLTVEVDISVQLRQEVQVCDDYDAVADICEGSWNETVTHHPELMTVTESQQTTVNQLDDGSGQQIDFEADDDRVGAAVHPDTAWSAMEVDDNARVRGNWWFYSAGKTGWHTMATSTETNTSRANSSVRPAQVHAVPYQDQPDVPSSATDDAEPPLVIEEAWGSQRDGPDLPEAIDITPAETYVSATSVAMHSETLPVDVFDEVTVDGVVRGQSHTLSLSEARTVRETSLELTVLEANSTRAVVQAEVTENATGDPVPTGEVEIGNQSATVNASGMAVLEVEAPALLVQGQYIPEEWWHAGQLYSPSEDRAQTPANFPEFQAIVQLVLVTLLWFVPVTAAVYGFDYLSGGDFLGLTNQQ